MQLTSGREVAGFFLTQVIRITVQAMVGAWVLAPLYGQLIRNHASAWFSVVSIGFGAVMWFAALPLFLAFRALFGGVPRLVAAAGGERSFTSSGREIGAYVLSYVIVLLITTTLATAVLASVYAALRASNHQGLVFPVSIAYSVVIAALFFVIFIGLRRAFAGATPPPR